MKTSPSQDAKHFVAIKQMSTIKLKNINKKITFFYLEKLRLNNYILVGILLKDLASFFMQCGIIKK